MSIYTFAVAALVALPAFAQAPSPAAPADKPAAPQAAAGSAFDGYRAWRDPDAADWRAANATAGALGGHMGQVRGHGREPSRPAADTRPAGAPAPAAPAPGTRR